MSGFEGGTTVHHTNCPHTSFHVLSGPEKIHACVYMYMHMYMHVACKQKKGDFKGTIITQHSNHQCFLGICIHVRI